MTSWNTIRRALKDQAPAVRPEPAEAFWADFSARARLVRQEAPRPARHPLLWTSMALAGATALLLLLLWPAPAAAEATHVTALEVVAPHDAAMILNVVSENGRESGAIVWISGLEENP
jgi:hypothetical protein